MATETVAIGRKRKSEEMLEDLETQGRAQKTESINNEADAKGQDVQGHTQETELDIDNKPDAKDQDVQGRAQEAGTVDREEAGVKQQDVPDGSPGTDSTIDYDSDATIVMDTSNVPFHKRTYDVKPPPMTKPHITAAASRAIDSNDSDTEDGLPQAQSRHRDAPPAYTRTILPKPGSSSSGWVPPVRGLFAPPLPPRGTFAPVRGSFAPVSARVRSVTAPVLTFSVRDPVAVTAPVFSPPIRDSVAIATPVCPPPIRGPVALDTGGRPYPSPYNSYPTKRTILDYEGARARAGTSLVPTEQRGYNERYTSVLECDVAILTGRLARSNYEKTAAVDRVAEQAREITSLRASVMRLENERNAQTKVYQDRMDEIVEFMLEHLQTGTEVFMDMFEVPK